MEYVKYFLMLILSDIIFSGYFALNKLYQRSEGTSMAAGFLFNTVSGLVTLIVFLAISGFCLEFTVLSCVFAFLQTIMMVIYTLLGFKLLKEGSITQYTLFLMIGGMTVPYVWGLLFLNEEFSWLRTFALLVILLGVAIANFEKGKTNVKMLLMYIAVFVSNGFVSVISKIHQLESLKTVTVGAVSFIMLCSVFQTVICGIGFMLTRKNYGVTDEKRLSPGKILVVISGAALMYGFSYLLQLEGAAKLPATVMYPVVTGGIIVFSTLLGAVAFREKLSAKLIISVCLCFVGTLMFL